MKMKKESVILNCFRKNRALIILFAAFFIVNVSVYLLYGQYIEPFIYGTVLCLFFLICYFLWDYSSEKKRQRERDRLKQTVLSDKSTFPEEKTPEDRDYGEIIRMLNGKIEELTSLYERRKRDTEDYYTAWVHQIKTPIAVMKLQLSDEMTDSKALAAELFRIEHYVDMALNYIRLESEDNDLLIEEYDIDETVREILRKYASQFILKKVTLEYNGINRKTVTDKKWFSFILEQFISNAVKYTPSGGKVTIGLEGDSLTVKDNGIGIASEDIPRIFEKGYTGVNGRIGQKSSGLGLYLSRMAADKLSLTLICNSTPGEGSTFGINVK